MCLYEPDETDENVSIVFIDRLEERIGDARSVSPTDTESIREESGVSRYSYRHDPLALEPQY